MSERTVSEIFLAAAERLEQKKNVFCCHALYCVVHNTDKLPDTFSWFPQGRLGTIFLMFAPGKRHTGAWWGCSDLHKEDRITTLLFCAAIAEGETYDESI